MSVQLKTTSPGIQHIQKTTKLTPHTGSHRLKPGPVECTQFDACLAEDVAASEQGFYNECLRKLEK